MKIALLGGSFDPVHLGHLLIADEALSRFCYDRVIFVPACVSPHKASAEPASSEDRLAMLNAAVMNDPRFLVDDCELRRSGISYTIDTVEDIERRYRPDGKLGVIIGEDLVDGFSTWRRVDELVSRVDLILAARPGFSSARFSYPHRRLDNSTLSVSSSGIRALIARGEPWRFLLPEPVRRMVEDRGLYGATQKRLSETKETINAVEALALHTLSSARYLHSRGVAFLASLLCGRFGLDPEQGYLAGIAHDICKESSADRIVSLALLDGKPISEIEKAKPALLHARAAACFLESRFSYREEAVLESIRHHTFGASGMGRLAKVVYIADKIEPSRVSVSPGLRDMIPSADLDALFAATVADTIRYLRERGKVVSEDTERLAAECREHADESRTS